MRALAFLPLLLAAAPQAAPLNLLLITADDLNADSMGWMGSKAGATPRIDAFAATCHRFEQLHVSVPICQPSRAAFMTGRVPHRNGALGFHPVRSDVPTLPVILQAKGYFLAAINKLKHMEPKDRFPWDLALDGSGKNPGQLRAHVEQCLKAAAEKKKPFFLNANITDPHRPFPAQPEASAPLPSFLENVPDVRREVGQYFAGVRRFDESFGEILAGLKASGQEDRTLVAFLSDHGMAFPFSKATVYRNGTWTPLLLRWPGMGAPAVNRDLVSSVDLLPTILDVLGVEKPAGLDGRSLLPLLKGEPQEGRDHVVTHVNTVSSGAAFTQRCVRTKTRSYLWHGWPDGRRSFKVESMSGLTFKALAAAGEKDPAIKARVEQYLHPAPEALYDLEKDPDERVNLVADPRYRADLDGLRRLLLSHMERTADPQLPAFRAVIK